MYELMHEVFTHPDTPNHLKDNLMTYADGASPESDQLFDVLSSIDALRRLSVAVEALHRDSRPLNQLADQAISALQMTADTDALEHLIGRVAEALRPYKDADGFIRLEGIMGFNPAKEAKY